MSLSTKTTFSNLSGPKISLASPAIRPSLSRRAVIVQASEKIASAEKVAATTVGLTAVACTLPQVASAAQEVLVLAEGEPLVVQAGWAALAVSFTMSIAIVVWGRSGL